MAFGLEGCSWRWIPTKTDPKGRAKKRGVFEEGFTGLKCVKLGDVPNADRGEREGRRRGACTRRADHDVGCWLGRAYYADQTASRHPPQKQCLAEPVLLRSV